MATLFTEYDLVTLTVAEFGSYSLIRAAADDDTTAVRLALADSGEIDFSGMLGFTSAEIFGSSGDDRIVSGKGADRVSGNDGADYLYGLKGVDRLYGGIGNDHLYGGAGKDLLYGGEGSDTLIGGLGDDKYFVDSSLDIVSEGMNSGVDTVFVSSTFFRLSSQVENMTVVSSDHFRGFGNNMANVLVGGAGNDQIFGLNGKDTLYGGADDTLVGGNGNDIYHVVDDPSGWFSTVIVEGVSGGTDTLFCEFGVINAIAGLENITVVGHDNARIVGNDDANILIGNVGADTFFANGGNDTMTGGDSVDMFFFADAASVDTITDFDVKEDSLLLMAGAFDALEFQGGGPIKAEEFKEISTGTVDSSDRILYDFMTGKLYYDVDGAGGQDQVLFAVLRNHAFLTSNDIQLTF